MRVQRIATVDELLGAYSVNVRHDGFDERARRVHLTDGDGSGEEA